MEDTFTHHGTVKVGGQTSVFKAECAICNKFRRVGRARSDDDGHIFLLCGECILKVDFLEPVEEEIDEERVQEESIKNKELADIQERILYAAKESEL